MRRRHWIVVATACGALAGCGGATVTSETTVPDTTPHGSPPQTILSEAQEKLRAQKAFEQVFKTTYIASGNLRSTAVRFRTPCEAAGAHQWKCEGWGFNSIKNCIDATSLVSGIGVVGSLEEQRTSRAEAGYAVCSNGSDEGRPLGDLEPEP